MIHGKVIHLRHFPDPLRGMPLYDRYLFYFNNEFRSANGKPLSRISGKDVADYFTSHLKYAKYAILNLHGTSLIRINSNRSEYIYKIPITSKFEISEKIYAGTLKSSDGIKVQKSNGDKVYVPIRSLIPWINMSEYTGACEQSDFMEIEDASGMSDDSSTMWRKQTDSREANLDAPPEDKTLGLLEDHDGPIVVVQTSSSVIPLAKIPQPIKKDTFMSTVGTQLIDQNKQAAKLAAQLEVGSAATKIAVSKIKGSLPPLVRIYSDHPAFSILIANSVAAGIKQFAPGSTKANLLADAMIQSAMVDAVREFNIAGMIEDLVSGVDLGGLEKVS